MEVKIKKTMSIDVSLTVKEAIWLKNISQNEILNEDQCDKAHREMMWNKLPSITILIGYKTEDHYESINN